MKRITIKNNLRSYLELYARNNQIKYSDAVKTLATYVEKNHRYIYALANGNSQASAQLQFEIASFFNESIENIFFPVMSGNDIHLSAS